MISAAAAALIALGIVGAVVLTQPTYEPADVASTATLATQPVAGPGRMTTDQPPVGMAVYEASESVPTAEPKPYVIRIYASGSSTPERDPYVRVSMMTKGEINPSVGPGAEEVRVGEVAGQRWTVGGVDHVVFARAGHWYVIDSHAIDDPVALAATARQAEDGYGAVIDQSLLPTDVTTVSAGIVEEFRFIARQLTTLPITGVHWETSPWGDRGIYVRSLAESADEFRFHRVEVDYEGVSAVDIHGLPGVQAKTRGLNPVNVVMWNDGVRTYILTGWSHDQATPVGDAELIDVANSLRPATVSEWQAMQSLAAVNRQAMEGSTVTTVTFLEHPADSDPVG